LREVALDVALAVHEAQIAEHGGALGIREPGLLESALLRPKTARAYTDDGLDTVTLAALHAIAIIRNRPFVDGNKRVGLTLLELFLNLHGFTLDADDAAAVSAIVDLAAGEASDEYFIDWVRRMAIPVR